MIRPAEPEFPPSEESLHFMKLALQQAVEAFERDETPVGAIIVGPEKRIIGAASNQKIQLVDPTAHAEVLAITQAAAAIGDWRLEGCTLYVTLEPCPMCAGAILQSRIPKVVFGAFDEKGGAVRSKYKLLEDDRLNHQCEVTAGVLKQDCADILTVFFKQKRAMGKK